MTEDIGILLSALKADNDKLMLEVAQKDELIAALQAELETSEHTCEAFDGMTKTALDAQEYTENELENTQRELENTRRELQRVTALYGDTLQRIDNLYAQLRHWITYGLPTVERGQ